MSTILLSVDSDPGKAASGFRTLASTLGSVDTAFNKLTKAVTTCNDALDLVARGAGRALGSLDMLGKGAVTCADALRAMTGEARSGAAALGRLATAADGAGVSLGRIGAAATSSRAPLLAVTGTVGDQIRVVDALAASYGRLGISMHLPTPRLPIPTTGGNNGVGGGSVGSSSSATSSASNFGRAGNLLRTGVAETAGLPGRFVNAALGPEGLVAGAALYGGFKSAQMAQDFWGNVVNSAAQSRMSTNGGPLTSQAQQSAFGKSILDYAASGKSPYTAATLASQNGIEPLMATVNSTAAILAGMPSIAQLAFQNKASDLQTAVQAVTTVIGIGAGRKATGADITRASDFVSAAEQMTKASPGLLTRALPTVLTGTAGLGMSKEDATGLLLKMGTINPKLQYDSTAINQMISEMLVKPTAGAQTLAGKLGLEIGSGALAHYGSIQGMMNAYQEATAGPKQQDLLAKLLPQKNALAAFKDIALLGGGVSQAAGFTDALNKSAGNQQTVFDAMSKSSQTQGIELQSRLNADMTTLGTTLNTTVTPALLKMADAGVKGMESFAHMVSSMVAGPGGKGGAGETAAGTIQTLINFLNPTSRDFGKIDAAVADAHAQRNAFAKAQTASASNILYSGGMPVIPENHGQYTPAQIARYGTPDQQQRLLPPSQRPVPPMPPPPARTNPLSPSTPMNPYNDTSGWQGNPYNPPLGLPPLRPPAPPAPPTPGTTNFASGIAGYVQGILGTAQHAAEQARTARQAAALAGPLKGVAGQTIDAPLGGTVGATLPGLSASLQHVAGQIIRGANYAGAVYQARITKDEGRISNAQDRIDYGTQMGMSPDALLGAQKAQIAATRQLYLDSVKPGTGRDKLLRGLDRQEAVDIRVDKQGNLTRAQRDFQSQIAIDQAHGNLSGAAGLEKALLALNAKNAGLAGYDKWDLLLQAIQANTQGLILSGKKNDLQNASTLAQINNDPIALKKADAANLAFDTAHRNTPGMLKSTSDLAVEAAQYKQSEGQLAFTRKERDLQNAIGIAQANGNTAGTANASAALLAYHTKNAKALGLDSSDLALEAAQNKAAKMARNTPNPAPFHENRASLPGEEAGLFGVAVRFGGSGVDPATAEIRKLTQELAAERAQNRSLLQQIANNTKQAREQAARVAPPGGRGPH